MNPKSIRRIAWFTILQVFAIHLSASTIGVSEGYPLASVLKVGLFLTALLITVAGVKAFIDYNETTNAWNGSGVFQWGYASLILAGILLISLALTLTI